MPVDFLEQVSRSFGINGNWLLSGSGPMSGPEPAVDPDASAQAIAAVVSARLRRALDRVSTLEQRAANIDRELVRLEGLLYAPAAAELARPTGPNQH
jgi:hypothetical protein